MNIVNNNQKGKKEIKNIYDDAVLKINKLAKKRKDIISNYVKSLEIKKIEKIRKSLYSK